MSLSVHLENLERKHTVLENLIHLETTRPLPDFVRITQLKRQKLRLKEQLSHNSAPTAAA